MDSCKLLGGGPKNGIVLNIRFSNAKLRLRSKVIEDYFGVCWGTGSLRRSCKYTCSSPDFLFQSEFIKRVQECVVEFSSGDRECGFFFPLAR